MGHLKWVAEKKNGPACWTSASYNLNVRRQSACLVFNLIMVDNYAASFHCTPVVRASDSMTAPTI